MEIPPISFDKILKCLETDVYPFFYLALESDGSKPNYYFRSRDEFIKLGLRDPRKFYQQFV